MFFLIFRGKFRSQLIVTKGADGLFRRSWLKLSFNNQRYEPRRLSFVLGVKRIITSHSEAYIVDYTYILDLLSYTFVYIVLVGELLLENKKLLIATTMTNRVCFSMELAARASVGAARVLVPVRSLSCISSLPWKILLYALFLANSRY